MIIRDSTTAGARLNTDELIVVLTALAKRTRLEAFRLLVSSGTNGLAGKDLGKLLGIRKHAATTHLATLAKAGLVVASHQDGAAIYHANLGYYDEVMRFLTDNVRGGKT